MRSVMRLLALLVAVHDVAAARALEARWWLWVAMRSRATKSANSHGLHFDDSSGRFDGDDASLRGEQLFERVDGESD